MDGLDIVGTVVAPSSSHAFGLDVIGHNLVVIREGCAAYCALPILLTDFSVQQLSHLCWRAKFAIPPGVVRIVDPLNAKLKSPFFPRMLATAAEQRTMDWAEFIPTEFHGDAPV
jgi:hypothetical protein